MKGGVFKWGKKQQQTATEHPHPQIWGCGCFCALAFALPPCCPARICNTRHGCVAAGNRCYWRTGFLCCDSLFKQYSFLFTPPACIVIVFMRMLLASCPQTVGITGFFKPSAFIAAKTQKRPPLKINGFACYSNKYSPNVLTFAVICIYWEIELYHIIGLLP